MKNIELLEAIFSSTDYVILDEFGGDNRRTKVEFFDIVRHFQNENITFPSGIFLSLPSKYACFPKLKKDIKNLPIEIKSINPIAVLDFGFYYYFILPRSTKNQSTKPDKIQLKAIVESKIIHTGQSSPVNITTSPTPFSNRLIKADYNFAATLPPQSQSETIKSIIKYFEDTHQVDLDYNYEASQIFSALIKDGIIIHKHPVYYGKDTVKM